ncbi:MAG: CARDB domain-containing protein [Solirubrobacterales bacterium]
MAFLDEEEQIAAADEPDRSRRGPAGPQRRRQQYLVRRLIAVGVGVAFLILVVIAFRGCLEARSDRGIRNYSQDIGTIMLESQQRGEEFFAALEGEGGLTEQQAEQRIAAVRGASATLLDRAEALDAPGQVRDAHSATTQALKLRRDALEKIAENIGQATADTERADSIDTVTTQMGSLYASDILWSQLAVPEMESVIESEGVDASDLPPGNFMPEDDPTEFLDQTSVTELLNNLSGEEATAGVHGLELVQVDAGDVTLSPDSTTTVDSAANEVSVQVQNGGDSEESGVVVTITFNGAEETKEIASIGAGAIETANIPLGTLPQPGTETTLEVLVEPVPGEEDPTNNEASYTIVFGTG